MGLCVYNTLKRDKEPFQPLHPPQVGVYVCGPTVYGHSHVGHAKSYISFDVIVRWLRYSGYDVTYVQNITDVGHLTDNADDGEDKVIAESRRRGRHPMAIAEAFTCSYLADMDALGCERPDIQPRATGHITEQIALCQKLIEAGHAYEVNGSVYYSVRSFAGYGKLSGRVPDELVAGARVDVVDEKRDPLDFAVWKAADPSHIMQWPSPWGLGFPGWHLECSAMSMKYLGETFDIHGGGLENQFPHHECEICQSEGATGAAFAKYWLHNHMVTVGGEKMGKSKGNFVLIKDIIDPDWPVHPLVGRKYDPLVLRYYVLSSHYRSDLDFNAEGLEAAENGLKRLHTAVAGLRRAIERAGSDGGSAGIDLDRYRNQFAAAMDDDFGAPNALAVLFELTREVNGVLNSGKAVRREEWQAVHQVYADLGGAVLGLVPNVIRSVGGIGLGAQLGSILSRMAGLSGPVPLGTDLTDLLMDIIIGLRKQAKADRNFTVADQIRDQLKDIGVILEDGRDGTTWRMA
jgi:cysteinyl-tRNA synthetase